MTRRGVPAGHPQREVERARLPRRAPSARGRGTRARPACATGRPARRAGRGAGARSVRRSRPRALPLAIRADLRAVAALRHHAPTSRAVLRSIVEDRSAGWARTPLEPRPRPVELGEERDREDPPDRTPYPDRPGGTSPSCAEPGASPASDAARVERAIVVGVRGRAHVLARPGLGEPRVHRSPTKVVVVGTSCPGSSRPGSRATRRSSPSWRGDTRVPRSSRVIVQATGIHGRARGLPGRRGRVALDVGLEVASRSVRSSTTPKDTPRNRIIPLDRLPQPGNLRVTGHEDSSGYGRSGRRSGMHPILSQELLRALQHEMNERVGRPRAPRPRESQALASAHPMSRRHTLRGGSVACSRAGPRGRGAARRSPTSPRLVDALRSAVALSGASIVGC